jgi:MFS-type transporter involved in bile tolerance (Atg22 family)
MRLTLVGSIAAITLLVIVGPMLTHGASNLPVDVLADLGGSGATRFALVALVAVTLGLCLGTAPVSARTVLSATAPPARQGRVFATQATLAHAAVVPPLLLSGWGTQYAGPWPTLALIGLLGLGMLLALETGERRRGASVATGGGLTV